MRDMLDAVRLAVCPTPEDKAMRLLLSHLTVEQQKQVTTLGYFDVPIKDGDVLRFHNVQHGFLEQVKVGRAWCVFTVPPSPYVPSVPAADETLTKKLLWEANPQWLFRIANPMAMSNAYLRCAHFFAPGYRPEGY